MDSDVNTFFNAVIRQDAEQLRAFFAPGAVIHWPNTNEIFSVSDYLRANCEYPNQWDGSIENVQICGDQRILVASVWNDQGNVFRVVSFATPNNEGIIESLTEYWGDVNSASVLGRAEVRHAARVWDKYFPSRYVARVRDPDGNNCVVCTHVVE